MLTSYPSRQSKARRMTALLPNARVASMVDDGLAHINGDNIKVTEEGRTFVRSVCAVFDTYLQTSKGRHSSAV